MRRLNNDRMVDIHLVRAVALGLPRSREYLIRDRVKFKVGRIVYVDLSHDETVMGFAYPKEERGALIQTEPDKFLPPERRDERYNWVQVRLDRLDEPELRSIVFDAWCMVVPQRLAADQALRMDRRL
jgi:hypothetical protein